LPLVAEGLPIVVVTSNETRRLLYSKVSGGSEDIVVLSQEEIVPEIDLQVVGTVDAMKCSKVS
jgi:flagellar biosynthesis component FlhA